jgi:hypothetical protein
MQQHAGNDKMQYPDGSREQ